MRVAKPRRKKANLRRPGKPTMSFVRLLSFFLPQ
jgi:hypothetical protein